MSGIIKGDDPTVVKYVSTYVDRYYSSSAYLNGMKDRVDNWEKKKPSLVYTPFYEQYYRDILDQYEKAAKQLKEDAAILAEKTNHESRKRYHVYDSISNSSISFLKKIHTEAETKATTDYLAGISNKRKESERRESEAVKIIQHQEAAAKKYSEIDKTFPIQRDQLLKENPAEYLRLSTLYHHKLRENKDEKGAIAFGTSWMQTLPKEASWEQVENMTVKMLQTAKNPEDLKEYRAAFKQWLREHPLSESSDAVSITPELAETPWGRRTYLLGLLHRNDPIDSLSLETLRLYRNCSALRPKISFWKTSLVFNHIFKKEWVEAEQLLAGLPPEEASVQAAQKCLMDSRLERATSATIDVGLMALNLIIPSSYRELAPVDCAFTAANVLSNNTVKGIWLPQLLGNPDRAASIRQIISPSLVTIGADIVDCIFRNIHALNRFQKAESFGSNLVRIGYAGWGMYNYTALRTWSAAPNIFSLALSSGQMVMDWRDIRRPPGVQAMISTVQNSAANIGTVYFLASYSDLAPLAWTRVQQFTGSSKSSISTPTISETETNQASDKTWIFVAVGIGTVALYHFCFHYPYSWAAAVMHDALREHFEGKYDDAKRVFAESEKSHLVARTRPDVREFAKYLDSLQNYQTSSEDPEKYTKLQVHFSLILEVLKKSDHYRGVRLSLLMRKAEITLQKQDLVGLADAIKEDYKSKVTECSFRTLLSLTYHFALKNPTAARSYLTKMSPAFPPYLNPKAEALDNLLEKHAQPLQEWAQQSLPSLSKNPPSPQKAEAWNRVLQELQVFFSKNVGKLAVYQDLQYFRLILSVFQSNAEQTEALFKESEKEVHLRLSKDLIQQITILRKNRRYQEVIDLLKQARFNSFKDNKLIQDYGYFFALAFLSPPQKELEQLDSCIAALDPKNNLHQELQVFFNAARIVVTLDTGKSDRARELLAQEKEGSKIPAEVAAILFERVNMTLQKKGREKALSDLKALDNLGSWEHAQLFKSFEAYLSSEPPLVDHIITVITHLQPLEKLSDFILDLKIQRFTLCLSQEKYETAKSLLREPMSKEFGSELKRILSQFLIYRGEELREKRSLREARETLQHLKAYFSISSNDVANHYVNFLVGFENLQNSHDLKKHLETIQILNTVLDKVNSISLWGEKIEILRSIALLAIREGQVQIVLQTFNTALKDLEPLKRAGMPVDHLEKFIRDFKERLIASSK